MHTHPLTRALALLGIVAFSTACGPDDCPGGYCECGDTNVCDFTCGHVPCTGLCESVSECLGTCGDACDLTCRSASDCDLACGDDCLASCRSVSTCAVSCGDRCAVECSDLSSCSVVMFSGEVRCERVSSCDVECILPDGGRAPAYHCGGGTYRCEPC